MELITQNICAGGAYFETSDPLPLNILVSLNMAFEIPGKMNGSSNNLSRIKVFGKVVQSDKNGMAIKFNNGYKIEPLEKKTSKNKL